MAESSRLLSNNILILYDQFGHILFLSDAHPPYEVESLVGLPAWHALGKHDALVCKSAILTCSQSKTPQTFDVEVEHVGLWRTTITPCHVGKVAIIGNARKHPLSVLSLTDRQREICGHLGAGFTSLQIAKQLDLARETIDNHRSAIAKRIGIKPFSLVAWCGEHREWF